MATTAAEMKPELQGDTQRIEKQTEKRIKRIQFAKLGFVVGATASFLLSVFLWFSGSRDEGLFVGIWVPSILSFGALILSGKSHG